MSDHEYLAERERRERELADLASDSSARRVHLDLADRYSARLRALGGPAAVVASDGGPIAG